MGEIVRNKKAILSLSGGLDSTCLLLYLLSKGYQVKAYSFSYGQKHTIELQKVKKNIEFLKHLDLPVDHQIIDLTDCFSDSCSSLSSFSGEEIPEGNYKSSNMESTVVENRNVIFASILYGKALSWSKKSEETLFDTKNIEIFLGIHAGDHTIYPDCTPESRQACEKAFEVSNWGSEYVNYQAPFENLTKAQVLREGLRAMEILGFNPEQVQLVLSNTHTCYNPTKSGKSCGKCGSCNERILSFHELGLVDPIQYVKPWEEVLENAKNQ